MPEKNYKLNNKPVNYVLSMSRKLIIASRSCYERLLYYPELPYRQYYLD
jgi:hypothetical protein